MKGINISESCKGLTVLGSFCAPLQIFVFDSCCSYCCNNKSHIVFEKPHTGTTQKASCSLISWQRASLMLYHKKLKVIHPHICPHAWTTQEYSYQGYGYKDSEGIPGPKQCLPLPVLDSRGQPPLSFSEMPIMSTPVPSLLPKLRKYPGTQICKFASIPYSNFWIIEDGR